MIEKFEKFERFEKIEKFEKFIPLKGIYLPSLLERGWG